MSNACIPAFSLPVLHHLTAARGPRSAICGAFAISLSAACFLTAKAGDSLDVSLRAHSEGAHGGECLNPGPAMAGSTQNNMDMPAIMYGTAWKAERTEDLVVLALRCGFRGVDTACQPKHYNEPGVGAGVRKGMQELSLTRGDLFLQSKFTPLRGQDPNRVPYDKDAPIANQVKQSVATTLKNIGTDYMDSLLMHSPYQTHKETMEAWRELERFHRDRVVRRLGISNCYDLSAFKRLYEDAAVKPTVLQNRFYKDSGYDRELRQFCQDHGVTYQSFWTLTANPHILESAPVQKASRRLGATAPQVLFRFVQGLGGFVPLTGTTSEQHMRQDLAAAQLQLSAEEAQAIGALIR